MDPRGCATANQILDVEQSQDGEPHGGMLIFELSADHHLVAIGRAARALPSSAHRWVLRGYAESRISGDQVQVPTQGERTLDSNISGQFLHLAMSEPGELASGALWSLVRYYRANSLDPKPYLFAFWSRIARTVAIAFAVLLAKYRFCPGAAALLGDRHAGLHLGRWSPELDNCLSLAVTEKRSRGEIDGLASALAHFLSQPTKNASNGAHTGRTVILESR